MPIPVQCQCGKSFNVKDQFAGRTLKCPSCGSALKIPGGAAPAAAPASPAASPAPNPAAGGGNLMSDLFDEEGFGTQVAAACPACGAEMEAGAVLCTKCGYHVHEGTKLDGHKTAGLDIDYGEVALQRAEASMVRDAKLQKDMQSRAGLPWWGLALVLFIMGSGLTLAVIAVNDANRVDGGGSFDTMKTFLVMSGSACGLVAAGALVKLIYHSVKKDASKGQMIKIGIVLAVMIGATVGLLITANNQ